MVHSFLDQSHSADRSGRVQAVHRQHRRRQPGRHAQPDSGFHFEPIGFWMRNYLSGPTSAAPAPTGLTGTPTNATAVLKWTTTPVAPTTYKVKRSQSNGGPYSVVASNVTEGVTATIYTDSNV